MAESNVEICRRAYAAFASGDMPTLETLMAPDVTWIVSGRNALTGTYRGREATFGYFARLLEVTGGTLTLTLKDVVEIAPGSLLAICRLNAQARGQAVDEDLIQQLEVHHGQCTSCRTFVEDSQLWDDLVGPAVITLPTEQARETASTL